MTRLWPPPIAAKPEFGRIDRRDDSALLLGEASRSVGVLDPGAPLLGPAWARPDMRLV